MTHMVIKKLQVSHRAVGAGWVGGAEGSGGGGGGGGGGIRMWSGRSAGVQQHIQIYSETTGVT